MSATRGRYEVPQRRMTSSPGIEQAPHFAGVLVLPLGQGSDGRSGRPRRRAREVRYCVLDSQNHILTPGPGEGCTWHGTSRPIPSIRRNWTGPKRFVREEVEPLDLVFPHLQFTPLEGKCREAIDPLKEEVRRQNLWATHLGADLGGQGYGQLKLALLDEILGRSSWAPIVFGCQAPDTGNAEIIAHYGTDAQKKQYLQPLLVGRGPSRAIP